VPFSEQKIEVQQQPFFVLGVHTRACIFLKKERDCQAMEEASQGLAAFYLLVV
jgi:hypothetical protein